MPGVVREVSAPQRGTFGGWHTPSRPPLLLLLCFRSGWLRWVKRDGGFWETTTTLCSQGWLGKRYFRVNRWSERYFVLEGHTLYYFPMRVKGCRPGWAVQC